MAQVEGHLEEMLELCKRSEQYSHFMLGAAGEAGDPLDPAVENKFRSGRFNVIVRELIAYYVNLVRAAVHVLRSLGRRLPAHCSTCSNMSIPVCPSKGASTRGTDCTSPVPDVVWHLGPWPACLLASLQAAGLSSCLNPNNEPQ